MLRDYQSEIIDVDDFDCRAGGVRSALLTAPTGSGKTVIAAAIATSAIAAGQHLLALAHCREIERYARIAPLAGFIGLPGGARLGASRAVSGERG